MIQGILIDNQWQSSELGDIAVVSPSDGQEFARIQRGGEADVERAVYAARQAFENSWERMPAFEKGRLLHAISQRILAEEDALTELEARDTGKPIKQARVDIQSCARYFEYYAGAADKIHGETIPFLADYQVMILREPLGVVGHVIPWNYPAQMFGRTVAASLAAGNTCVLKPSEDACMSTLRLAEIAIEAGLPAGVLNLVTGYGTEAGAALSASPGIDFMTFTGSPEVGTLVQQATAANHVGCTLELGGKSPQIVFPDADLEQAVEFAVRGILQNTGQTCSAGSRILVHDDIREHFCDMLTRRFESVRAGAHGEDLDCGALIHARQKDRVLRFIDTAKELGIEQLVEGGVSAQAPEGGFYVNPVVFGPVPKDAPLAKEEVFGPVLCVMFFTSEDDALTIANGTDYGLVAGIWTRDGARQMRMAKGIRAGQVFINGYGAGGGIELPFGGSGKSGHGREKGLEGLLELTTTKTIVLRHDGRI